MPTMLSSFPIFIPREHSCESHIHRRFVASASRDMFLKRMSGIRDLSLGGFKSKLRGALVSFNSEDFAFDRVLRDASTRVGLSHVTEHDVPDLIWWKQLCSACEEKKVSASGGLLLREKLVNSLGQRLAVEEAYRTNGHEIEKEEIVAPFIVFGLPRSGGHLVAHVFARSGLFLAPRMRDTWSPSLIAESERRVAFNKASSQIASPDFSCVRVLNEDVVDDDLTLQMHVPFSYAWGLLHGLDEFLLKSIQEDQTAVYQYLLRVLKLFQWYHRCGHFSDCVAVEFNTIDNPMELQRAGPKITLTKQPWLLHCPFGILNAHCLHSVFPDMNLLWIHRALAQGIPSLCSSLAIHNSLYTGRPPSDTSLAQIGEKVLGMFGSGSESAIDYFADFPKDRMVHWSNRDANRHCVRLMMKTMEHFKLEIDRHRRIHSINAQTEFQTVPRPLHDSQLQYFALHEGVVGHVFNAYITQFDEFAFEKKFGVTVQNYQSLATTNDEQLITKKVASDRGTVPSIGEGQPQAGHFLQESNLWK